MTNRMKPLLATYHANRKLLEKIATQRIASSGEYARMSEQLDGRELSGHGEVLRWSLYLTRLQRRAFAIMYAVQRKFCKEWPPI